MFEGLDEAERLSVLDVGPGKSSTLEFLAQFSAQVTFADLFGEKVMLDDPEATDSDRVKFAEAAFNEALGLAPDATLDVCLFWDYLHCLDRQELKGFSNALRPHVHRNTRGYAFGALHANVALDHNTYSIHDIDQLVRQPAEPATEHFPHTQKILSEAFPAFVISRGTLLQEGRLELLLSAA